jgi:hypothetical protein
MGECWDPPTGSKLVSIDSALMEKQELRAIANYFRGFHGADSFVTALAHARSLAAEGHLATAAVWNQIAEEISHIETHNALERCLRRGAS